MTDYPRVYDLYELTAPLAGGDPHGNPRAGQVLPYAAVRAGDPAPVPAADIVQVHERFPRDRLSLLLGFDHVLPQDVDVINCSLGFLHPFSEADPISRATRAVADAGHCLVVAAGNEGPDQDSMQELARASWVISVGATTPEGEPLASSSRGSPEVPGPTVVADGTDYYRPPVSMVVDFTNTGPGGQPTIRRPFATMEPGTSFAAPVVSRQLAFVRKVLETSSNLLAACATGNGDQAADPVRLPIIAFLDTGLDPDFAAIDEMGPWRRRAHENGWTHIQLRHTDEERAWCREVARALGLSRAPVTVQTLRRALPLMAEPVPGEPWVVGAGLVSPGSARRFSEGLTPSRLLQVLAPDAIETCGPGVLAGLDTRLGPVWSRPRVETFTDIYRTGQRLSICRVA